MATTEIRYNPETKLFTALFEGTVLDELPTYAAADACINDWIAYLQEEQLVGAISAYEVIEVAA